MKVYVSFPHANYSFPKALAATGLRGIIVKNCSKRSTLFYRKNQCVKHAIITISKQIILKILRENFEKFCTLTERFFFPFLNSAISR